MVTSNQFALICKNNIDKRGETKMGRVKIPNAKKINGWDDVDLTLKEIGEYQAQVEKLTADMNVEISDIKFKNELQIKPLLEKIEKLGVEIKNYVEVNKSDIKGKSKKMSFGELGFRKSTKLLIESVEDVLRKIKCFTEMDDCIEIKEGVNKTVLKKYPKEDIEKVGAILRTEEDFWYKTV